MNDGKPFNLPGVNITPCCPKCDKPMVKQPADNRWWCTTCSIGQPLAPIVAGKGLLP